ncbi:MAG: ATP-binding protein [Acidobacteria bacterium]|nr:ATP-binding protein [Acidobacteriota bacterium]
MERLARQNRGKSTISRTFGASHTGPATYFDLEDPQDAARLSQPQLALAPVNGLVVIDEVQRQPSLFPLLRVLADRPDRPASFLILGSASPELARQAAESLAGRIRYIELGGFDVWETGGAPESQRRLWLRGGMPRSFLAEDDTWSLDWRRQFIRTFLERDIPQLGVRVPAEQLRRFWTMVAHYHGQTWNASEIAGSLGVSATTASHYLDILTGALVIRQLTPWFDNAGKRLRRAPKVYLRDSGLLHALMGIPDPHALAGHPKLGASWEGFALEHVLRIREIASEEAFYWSIHGGAEIDLVCIRGGKRFGYEFKYADAPVMTKSLGSAVRALQLERAWVVVPSREGKPCATHSATAWKWWTSTQ